MRISDWSSDVCSSDLVVAQTLRPFAEITQRAGRPRTRGEIGGDARLLLRLLHDILHQAEAVGLTARHQIVELARRHHLVLCPPADPQPRPVRPRDVAVHVNAEGRPPEQRPPPPPPSDPTCIPPPPGPAPVPAAPHSA